MTLSADIGATDMPSLKHLSRQTPHEEIWQTFDHDGGLIIDDFLGPQTFQKLRDEVMPTVANHPDGAAAGDEVWQHFHGTQTTRTTAPAHHPPTGGGGRGSARHQ